MEDSFIFLGNQLALDFLNTRPLLSGEFTELLSDFEALAGWFQEARQIDSQQAAGLIRKWNGSREGRQAVDAFRTFRERLRSQVSAWEAGEPLRRAFAQELNEMLAKYPMRTRLEASAGGAAKTPWFPPDQPDSLFAPLAAGAVELFTEVDRNRVRKCGECVLHFYDTSKKGTRHWCSMQLCGNRSKVAAYAARQRSSG